MTSLPKDRELIIDLRQRVTRTLEYVIEQGRRLIAHTQAAANGECVKADDIYVDIRRTVHPYTEVAPYLPDSFRDELDKAAEFIIAEEDVVHKRKMTIGLMACVSTALFELRDRIDAQQRETS